jgi:hypothetical protein
MKLSKEKKDIIVNEFNEVYDLMKKSKDIGEKIFYYSATYAMVSRVFNIEFDPLLILMHSILQNTYNEINNFASNISNKQNIFFTLPKNYFDILENTLKDLIISIDKNEDHLIYKTLEKLSVIGYITTGNGNYLYKKGLVKI